MLSQKVTFPIPIIAVQKVEVSEKVISINHKPFYLEFLKDLLQSPVNIYIIIVITLRQKRK